MNNCNLYYQYIQYLYYYNINVVKSIKYQHFWYLDNMDNIYRFSATKYFLNVSMKVPTNAITVNIENIY